MNNPIICRNMHNPATRLRGSQMITMRGKWGTNARMRAFLRAGMEHGQIMPTASNSWRNCFTKFKGNEYFWFNDSTDSTKIQVVAG